MAMISTTQAAKILGVTSQTVRKLIAAGVLSAVRTSDEGNLRLVDDQVRRYATLNGLSPQGAINDK